MWEGDGVVKTGRVMLGATKPSDSAPGTLRGNNCLDVGRNIIHGSDCVEAAMREIALWFTPTELNIYKDHSVQWVYENDGLPPPKAKATKLGGGGIVIDADDVRDDGGDGDLDDFLDAFN